MGGESQEESDAGTPDPGNDGCDRRPAPLRSARSAHRPQRAGSAAEYRHVVKPRPGSHVSPRSGGRRAIVIALLLAAVAVMLTSVGPALGAGASATDKIAADTTPLPPSVTGDDSSTESTSSSGAGAISRMVVGLGIVLAVIFGVYWLLKRVYGGRGGPRAAGGMEVVASLGLGPNRTLQLVRIGDELVLVGVAGDQVTAIRSWDPADSRRLESTIQSPPSRPTGPAAGPPVALRPSLLDEIRRRTLRP